jgi:5-methylcytosine-specific restriction endonuclease McrA
MAYSKTRQAFLTEAKKRGRHSKSDWDSLRNFFKNKCVLCGGINQKWIEKDHIIPISLGGSDSINNIQPLCQLCNQSKSNKFAKDYREIRANIIGEILPDKYKNPF